MFKKYLSGYPEIRAVQKEDELLWLIKELMSYKVQSLLSIGLLDAGTEWHIARLYRDQGIDINITGIDVISSPALNKHINEIRDKFKQSFVFLQGSSASKILTAELSCYDAVLIDGNHSYQGAKKDFELALAISGKLIAFHDIVDSEYHKKQRCFVSRLWSEIKASGYKTEEMAGDDWAGIGIVYL